MMFVYRDWDKNETQRKLLSIREDEFYLYGYCEYSKGMRTFRKDRIVTLIDESELDAYGHIPFPTTGNRRKKVNEEKSLEICFSGFKAPAKKMLEDLARSKKLLVRTAVTKNLDLLCIGETAGPVKMKKAEDQGVCVITPDQLYDLVRDGVLPDNFYDRTKKTEWTEITKEAAKENFTSWFFEIKTAHWSALGIKWKTDFTDSEKTASLRAWWEGENLRYGELHGLFFGKNQNDIQDHDDHEEWLELKKERDGKVYKYPAYAISKPIVLDFHEGDVFDSGNEMLQVVVTTPVLEVKSYHKGENSIGYWLTQEELANWLKTGVKPSQDHVIDKNQSHSEIAKHYAYTQ
jgi:hypothetical protein